MSRTDLDPATLAASLRRMAGDGSVEWVTEPMQTRVLLDVADMLAENAKLRELVAEMFNACPMCVNCAHNHLTVGWYDCMRELGIEV